MQDCEHEAGQFVMLGIDQEVFAVAVSAVREILQLRQMFRIPDAPAYLAGLIDVRDRNVPVIDLRAKLNLGSTTPTEATRIVVLDVTVRGRQLVLGLIADRVFEVASLDDGKLESPPDLGSQWRPGCIRGIGRRAGSFVAVFDLEQLFSTDSHLLHSAGTAAPFVVTAE